MIRLKCPTCGEYNEVETETADIYSFPDFPCDHCGAWLRLANEEICAGDGDEVIRLYLEESESA